MLPRLTPGHRLSSELEIAMAAAKQAGVKILDFYRSKDYTVDEKSENNPFTDADLAANRIILSKLKTSFPQDNFISEESLEKKVGQSSHKTWIIDPMDGTKEFISRSPEFCVMIGLVENDRPILGVIFHPPTNMMYSGVLGEGAWITKHFGDENQNTERITLSNFNNDSPVRLVHSKNHRNKSLTSLLEQYPSLKSHSMGSAGLKCMAIVDDRADIYFHPTSHIKEWDTCAPEAIVVAAGGKVTNCSQSPLTYGKQNPRQSGGIIAARVGMPKDLLDIMQSLSPNE